MKMKRFVSIALCALMLLPILAGCGAKNEAPVATAAPAPAALPPRSRSRRGR